MNVLARAHIVSARNPQLRYVIRGTKGTLIKYGLDVQEDQLKAIKSPAELVSGSNDQYGKEPEALHGTLENFSAGSEVDVVQSMWVSHTFIY